MALSLSTASFVMGVIVFVDVLFCCSGGSTGRLRCLDIAQVSWQKEERRISRRFVCGAKSEDLSLFVCSMISGGFA